MFVLAEAPADLLSHRRLQLQRTIVVTYVHIHYKIL